MSNKIGRKILFSLVPFVVILGSLELYFRVMGTPEANPDRPFEHNEVYWLTDPNLENKPFPHREVNGSFMVSTDSEGLRAPLHQLEKPENTFRILMLGCSTTFGWGVNDNESYSYVLQENLDPNKTKIQVINGGQPGYTSFQGLWFYQNIARKYKPDLISFGYVVQDARRAAYSDKSQALLQKDSRFLKQNLLYKSALYLGLKTIIDLRKIKAKERSEQDRNSEYRVSREDYVANIRAFKDLAQQDGADLMLFGFPLERAGYTEEHRRLMYFAAEELKVPYLDMQKEMEELSRQKTLFFPEDRGHANADGNAVIAWRFEKFLKESGLIMGDI